MNGKTEPKPRGAFFRLLDALSLLGATVAAVVLVTGGGDIRLGGLVIHAGRIGNPLAAALILAALTRLMGREDALTLAYRRFGARVATRGIADLTGRLRAILAFRLDALVFALFALWSLDRAITGPVMVEGDGIGYYAYLRSALIDRDLDFLNEFRDYDPRQTWLDRRTPSGRVDNPFAIGPAILWAPAFATAWAVAPAFGAAPNGYSAPFVYACAATTWLLGIAAVALLHRLLLVQFPRSAALPASLAAVLASPLLYYLDYAPFYSHVQSFFAATLLLWVWARTMASDRAWAWLGLGLASGLVAITRWQDAVYWVVPALSLAQLGLREVRARGAFRAVATVSARSALFAIGLAAMLTPQVLAIRAVYGFWLGLPQGDSFMDTLPIHLGPTLFSWFHGLYSWTPLMLPATLGLALAAWARRPWTRTLLVALLVHLYANGCIAQWWAGAAFGARRFSSVVPLLAFGLAELLWRCRDRPRRRWCAHFVIAVAVAWNLLLAHLWLMSEIPHHEAIDPVQVLRSGLARVRDLDFRFLSAHETLLTELVQTLWGRVSDRLLLIASAAGFYALSVRRQRSNCP